MMKKRQLIRILFCAVPALIIGALFGAIFWNKGMFVGVTLVVFFLEMDLTRARPERGEGL